MEVICTRNWLTGFFFWGGECGKRLVWELFGQHGFKSPVFLMKNAFRSGSEIFACQGKAPVRITKSLKPPMWILKCQQDSLVVAKTTFESLISMIYTWVQGPVSQYASKCHLATLATHSIKVTGCHRYSFPEPLQWWTVREHVRHVWLVIYNVQVGEIVAGQCKAFQSACEGHTLFYTLGIQSWRLIPDCWF